MNLVVGATGMLGGEIVRLLREAGKPVRAMVRDTSDPAKVEALRAAGAEIVHGDLKDAASVQHAVQGVENVLSTASATGHRQAGDDLASVDLEGQMGLIDAARSAGVKHFVFISYTGGFERPTPVHQGKRGAERHLQQSGMTYTVLRPTMYMEVWLSPMLGFDPAKGRAQLFGSGDSPQSWMSFRDVARFAVQSLDNPRARNAVLELGGPEALSPNEVVQIFEEVGGRPIEVSRVPKEALEAQYESAQDPLEKSFAGFMLSYTEPNPVDMEPMLRDFPMRLRSVRDYAQEVMRG